MSDEDAAAAPAAGGLQVVEGQLEYLVIDSGAVIRGHGTNFHRRAKRFVTVQEVLSEVRDSKARELLAALPFELEVRTPSEEAMGAVAAFAKKSGDFAALSLTDIKLIALTYTLEKEQTGGLGIRKEPPRIQQPRAQDTKKSLATVFDAPLKQEELKGTGEMEGDNFTGDVEEEEGGGYDDDAEVEEDEEEEEEEEEEADDNLEQKATAAASGQAGESLSTEDSGSAALILEESEFPSLSLATGKSPTLAASGSSWVSVAKKDSHKPFSSKAQKKEQVVIPAAKTSFATEPTGKAAAGIAASKPSSFDMDGGSTMPSRIIGGSGGNAALESARAALEDDGEGWISVSNFRSALEMRTGFPGESDRAKKGPEAPKDVVVACVTTDFSMQNVMLQMGLHLVSVDGMVIANVKQWVLRCMACFHVHYQMDRLFCERCGANHLSRVSCSIDAETGKLKLHLKKNYRPNTRGMIYSLPKPGKQGRYEGELLLREDQLMQGIWLQKKMAVQRNLKSAFGDDVTGDVGLHINKGVRIKVGLGSRNPNADKGRERRGKPKR